MKYCLHGRKGGREANGERWAPMGNSAARRVDGARVPWRYRIWEQFLGQKLKTSFLLIGG